MTVPYTFDTFEDVMHSHDFCELVFYISGDIHFVVGNKIYSPQYGDLFIARPAEIHSGKLDKDSTYKRYVLWFAPDFFDTFQDGKQELAAFIFNREKGEDNMISLPEKVLGRVANLFNQIELALSYLLQIFSTINNNYKNTIPLDRSVPLPDCIIKATNYIEENYRELTSIADIANHSHISREHLSRLFKNYYGTTINNYINQKRINESKRLFELGANVTEACFSSGFNNVSYFIKIFHQKVGTTPLEYKHFINIPS
jgi:AraC-like DNA-binding protein